MNIVIPSGIILATLLATSSLFYGLYPFDSNNAEAYLQLDCPLQGSTFGWKNVNLNADYLHASQRAAALWNDAPANFFLDEQSTFEEIQFRMENMGFFGGLNAYASNTEFGNIECNPSTGYLYTPMVITYNTYNMDAYEPLKKLNTAAHEIGHALGLDHPDEGSSHANTLTTLMYSTDDSWDTYDIFYPTLDDIRGVQAWYGSVASTSTCTEYKVNGDVIHSGTCSGSNPAMPITEKVLVSGSGNRAFASQYSSAQFLPSSDILMITAKVDPTVLHRSYVGVFTSNNPSSATVFMGIRAEPGTAGWKTARSDATGATLISNLCSSCPVSTTQVYFVQLILVQGEDAGLAVYLDDGTTGQNGTPPTRLGTKLREPLLSWDSGVYYGTAVYQSGSTSTLSNWDVKQYHNRLKSWT